jgi:putative DNA primase/helicase
LNKTGGGTVVPMPSRAEINPENIPDDLKRLDRWVLWKYEQKLRKDGQGWTKAPYRPNGRRASHSDEVTWSSFEDCLSVIQDSNLFAGIGFVMGVDDLVAWDLDHCLDHKTMELTDWAQDIVKNMNSYTEVTPSGEGIRIFCRGELPQRGKKVSGLRDVNGEKKGGIECYNDLRYVTVTGTHWPSSPMAVETRDTDAEWHRVFDTIQSGLKSLFKNETVQMLWNGEYEKILDPDPDKPGEFRQRYGSQSEADLALVRQLVISSEGDAEAVDDLFRESKLMRPKWDEYSHFGQDHCDVCKGHPPMSYGQHTVATAMKTYERNHNLTDTGNARRFARILGDRVRFAEGQWYVWDGKRWAPDKLQRVYVLVDEVTKELNAIATDVMDEERRKAILKHARSLEGRGQVENMLKLAQARPPIPVAIDDLDAHDDVFVCDNGTLTGPTGFAGEHRPTDLMTKISPVTYVRSARGKRWSKFLEEILPDETIRLFLQRSIGYSMTGSQVEQKFFFLYGHGANGKSTFMEMMRRVFGDYFTRVPSSALMLSRNEQHPTGIMTLKGARLALATEVKQGKALNEELMKSLTGEGEVQARAMFQNFGTFRSTAKLWIMGNFKPVISGTDLGIWRRVLEIPFTVTIPPEKKDKNLWDVLGTELEGILAWCVEGWKMWDSRGLEIPPAIQQATDAYKEEMDVVGQFIAEMCDSDPKESMSHSYLYSAYVRWAEKQGERPMSSKTFSAAIGDKKNDKGAPLYAKFRGGGNVMHWSGLTLKKGGEPIPEDYQSQM